MICVFFLRMSHFYGTVWHLQELLRHKNYLDTRITCLANYGLLFKIETLNIVTNLKPQPSAKNTVIFWAGFLLFQGRIKRVMGKSPRKLYSKINIIVL